jgi:aspartate racemase
MPEGQKIGILGGAGAFAGLHIAKLCLGWAVAHGAEKDSDFPELVLYNKPCRGLDETGVASEAQFERDVFDGLDLLSRAKCDYGIVACNSAHYFFDTMQTVFASGKLISLVGAACKAVSGTGRVGVLCSETTRRKRLYSQALGAIGIEVVEPEDDEQATINSCINAAITGKNEPSHWESLGWVMSRMRNRGAIKIILGCTELPLIVKEYQASVIDPGVEAVKTALALF